MLRSKKKECVDELENIHNDCNLIIITHYHGITVAQMTALRKSLREKNAGFRIVKNTLSKIALTRTENNLSSEFYSGPTAIAYSADSFEAAKVIVDFAKNNEYLKIIGGVINKHLLIDSAGVKALAALPSLDELRSKIISILQAPAAKIVGVTSAPGAQLARLFKAYADKN